MYKLAFYYSFIIVDSMFQGSVFRVKCSLFRDSETEIGCGPRNVRLNKKKVSKRFIFLPHTPHSLSLDHLQLKIA